MAATTYTQRILYTGTQAAYNAATKDETRLYFTSDTHKIYKGSQDVTAAARIVTGSLPAAGAAANNVIYLLFDASDNYISANVTVDGGTTWTSFAPATIEDDMTSAVTSNSVVPTAKAVATYVNSMIGGNGVVSAVGAATTAGVIEVTDGAGATTTFAVPGVATKPTWDSTTRVLSIPYTACGSDAAGTLTVNIGKDAVVDSGEYHAATEEIWLWLSTHTKADYPNDPSIVIPVSSLIDEIEVEDTDSVNLTYTSATNTISADVRISSKTGNGLSIESGAGEEGLFVDISGFASSSDLSALEDRVDDAEGSIDNLANAVFSWATIA